MNDALTLNVPLFPEKVKENKIKVINQAKNQLNNVKVDILKKALDERNISYDNDITDFLELTSYLKKNLNVKEYEDIKIVITNINQKIEEVLKDLIAGSTNAFSKFLQGGYESLIKPLAEATTISLASRTALTLAPTLPMKLAVSGALSGYTAYKLIKNHKYNKIANKNYELNKILEELEVTKNKNNQICDTRFNKNIQDTIRNFFRENNINFTDTGYLSLREAIYSLPLPEKEKLCRLLINVTGIGIDIDKRLEKYNKNVFKKAKEQVVSPIVKTSVAGAAVATTINAIDPAILSTPINSTVVGTLISKLAKSPVVAWLSAGATGLLTAFGKFIPYVGEVITKILAIENISVFIALGAIVGAGNVVTKGVINVIKNIKDKFTTNKMQKEIFSLDSKLYEKDNSKEISLINQKLLDNVSLEEKAIIAIVCQYLNEHNIYCGSMPENINELKNIIKNLDAKNKIKAIKLLNTLINYNNKERLTFKKAVLKYGKMTLVTLLCGAASLSVYDILTGGDFLNNLVLRGIPEKLPTIDNTAMPIEKIPEPINNQPIPLQTPTTSASITPAPAATPSPMTTPKPITAVSPNGSLNLEQIKAIKYVQDPSTFVNSLQQLEPKDMFLKITDLPLNDHIKDCINRLEPNELRKLIDFLNTSTSLDKTTDKYKVLIDSLSSKIDSINLEITKQIDKKLRIANFSRKVGDASIPIAGISNIMAQEQEEEKTK